MKENGNHLYKECEYTEDWQIKKPIKGLIFYIVLFIFPSFIFLITMYEIIILRNWDWNTFILSIMSIIGVLIGYWIGVRIYWAMWKSYHNTVKITDNLIEIGTVFKAKIKDVERSVYNVSTGYLYIYLKSGKKFGICKDVSKISHFGGGTHFSYVEYGRALKKLGIPFEVVRKKGLFSTEAIMGKENYDEMNHEERYERWVENKRKKVRKHQKEDITK